MALIKDGVIYRTYEEQVAYLTAKNNEQKELNIEQKEINEDFEERIAALEEGGGGEPPANMMTTNTDQTVDCVKTFGEEDEDVTIISENGITVGSGNLIVGESSRTDITSGEISTTTEDENGVIKQVAIYPDSMSVYDSENPGGGVDLELPTESGKLALEGGGKKYYKHRISIIGDAAWFEYISFSFISSSNTPINTFNILLNTLADTYIADGITVDIIDDNSSERIIYVDAFVEGVGGLELQDATGEAIEVIDGVEVRDVVDQIKEL